MNYSELVETYERLEKTTKRLEKTEIVAELLKKAKEDLMEEIIFLLQGKVFPKWDERKIGMSSRLMIKAINSSTGVSSEKIEKEWARKGDLGIVIEELIKHRKQTTLFQKRLTVKKVFDNLQKLSELEGKGTVSKKIQLVTELLTSAKPNEAKFIARTVIEDLRIGVQDGIIRDSIAKAFLPKRLELKEFVKRVEDAYNLTNDFSEVANAAKNKKLNRLSMDINKPINPMLAIKVEDVKEAFKAVGKPAQAEYKMDGFRCISGHTPIYCLNKGYISIKDIKEGDMVLTHAGGFKRVLAVNKRTIDKGEKLFLLQTFFGDKFKISAGHEVLINRRGEERWIPVEKINKKTDRMVFPCPIIKEKSILNKYLRLGDDSGYSKKIKVNNFFFRFLGFWLGDGFTNNYHNTERVGLLFNNKTESDLAEFYQKNIEKNFGIKNITKSIQKNLLNLYFRDKPLRIWLSTHFRREWRGKRIPNWFLGISKIQFEQFIKGYLESDGHKDSMGRMNIVTKERDVAMMVQILATKFGKAYGIKKFRTTIKDKMFTYYRIVIPKSNLHYKNVGNKIFIKIFKHKEIKYRDPRTRLYNLQVENDESYCTSMVSLHNCQIHKKGDEVRLFTRRLENVTNQFKDLIPRIKENVKFKSCILDSELVGFDPKTNKYLPFQNISQRIKRKYHIEKKAKDIPVEINIFDILNKDGKSLMNLSQKERRDLLEKNIKEKKHEIVLVKKLVSEDVKKIERFYKESLKKGNEGVMIKNYEGKYVPGRRVGGWVKLKPVKENLDLVVTGADWGEGKRAKWLSSFTLSCRDKNKFLEIGKVGTGIKEKDSELSFIGLTKILKPKIKEEKGKKVVIKPFLILEVSYEEIQKSPNYSSKFALRFPRVVRVRTDLSLRDVDSLSRIEKIYNKQKK